MGSGPYWYQIGNKTCDTKSWQILCIKMNYAFKFVFYRPEHNAKGGPHGTEF